MKCYDKERCICSLFENPNYFDYEDRIYAINKYKDEFFDIKKLYSYAEELNIYDEVSKVFEVLKWN